MPKTKNGTPCFFKRHTSGLAHRANHRLLQLIVIDRCVTVYQTTGIMRGYRSCIYNDNRYYLDLFFEFEVF